MNIDLEVLRPGHPHTLTSGLCIAYACSGNAVLETPAPCPVPRDHAVRIERGAGTVLGVEENLMILASIKIEQEG